MWVCHQSCFCVAQLCANLRDVEASNTVRHFWKIGADERKLNLWFFLQRLVNLLVAALYNCKKRMHSQLRIIDIWIYWLMCDYHCQDGNQLPSCEYVWNSQKSFLQQHPRLWFQICITRLKPLNQRKQITSSQFDIGRSFVYLCSCWMMIWIIPSQLGDNTDHHKLVRVRPHCHPTQHQKRLDKKHP